jgi:hypothetical protein
LALARWRHEGVPGVAVLSSTSLTPPMESIRVSCAIEVLTTNVLPELSTVSELTVCPTAAGRSENELNTVELAHPTANCETVVSTVWWCVVAAPHGSLNV